VFSETSAFKIKMPGNHPTERKQNAFLSPKTSILNLLRLLNAKSKTETETNKSIIPKVCKAVSFS
jgi:hypothetical protein